jgi:hypothetical protein
MTHLDSPRRRPRSAKRRIRSVARALTNPVNTPARVIGYTILAILTAMNVAMLAYAATLPGGL